MTSFLIQFYKNEDWLGSRWSSPPTWSIFQSQWRVRSEWVPLLCTNRFRGVSWPFKSGGAKVKQDIFQAADWPGNFYGKAKCAAYRLPSRITLVLSPIRISRESRFCIGSIHRLTLNTIRLMFCWAVKEHCFIGCFLIEFLFLDFFA